MSVMQFVLSGHILLQSTVYSSKLSSEFRTGLVKKKVYMYSSGFHFAFLLMKPDVTEKLLDAGK